MGIIAYNPIIGPVPLDVILEEEHTSEIEITGNPIETGSEVNDHAYIMPKRVTLKVADAKGALAYKALVTFQESRVPFTLVTGLDVYRNMLIRRINPTRDSKTSQLFTGSIELQEVIIVSTATAAAGPDNGAGKNPGRQGTPNAANATTSQTADTVAGTVARGDNIATPVNAASTTNQSFLKSVF
jgi:hypothetical protein